MLASQNALLLSVSSTLVSHLNLASFTDHCRVLKDSLRSSVSKARPQTPRKKLKEMNIHDHSVWIKSSSQPLVRQGQWVLWLSRLTGIIYGPFLPDCGKRQPCAWGNRGDDTCEQECIFAEKQKCVYFLVVYGAVTVLTETNDVMLCLVPLLKSPRKWKQTFLLTNDSCSIKQIFRMHLPSLCLGTSRVLVIPRMY